MLCVYKLLRPPQQSALPGLFRTAEKAWHELNHNCCKIVSQHLPGEAVREPGHNISKMSDLETFETTLPGVGAQNMHSAFILYNEPSGF